MAAMFSTAVATVALSIWDSPLGPQWRSETLEPFLCLDFLHYKLSFVGTTSHFVYGKLQIQS